MSIPVRSVDVGHLLASYPHVERCPQCREYAREYLPSHPPGLVLVAVLNHHDSAHVSDRLDPFASRF